MRLLITGSDKAHAIETLFAKYIQETGTEVHFFPATSIFYDYYYKNIFNKIKYRLGFPAALNEINARFLKIVESFRPDVVWIFKGMEFTPATLQSIKEKGIKLVNYNPDNPFIFTGKGSGNKNITNAVSLYDLHFTYNLAIQEKLQNDYHAKTAFLPFGFDVSDEVYNDCITVPEIVKACFLGNPDEKRAAFIKELAAGGIGIDLFGNDWDKFISHENVSVFPAVYDAEFWKILRKYRVQINLMRVHNEDSHNMRTFEIPGIGGIMLAPETREHKMFFKNGEECFFFSNTSSCIDTINRLLQLDADKVNNIRMNARYKSVNAGYTYKERSAFVLNTLQQL